MNTPFTLGEFSLYIALFFGLYCLFIFVLNKNAENNENHPLKEEDPDSARHRWSAPLSSLSSYKKYDGTRQTLEQLMIEMRNSIASAGKNKTPTVELLEDLKRIVLIYRSLIREEYLPVLQEWILSEAKLHPSLEMEAIVQGKLWLNLGFRWPHTTHNRNSG